MLTGIKPTGTFSTLVISWVLCSHSLNKQKIRHSDIYPWSHALTSIRDGKGPQRKYSKRTYRLSRSSRSRIQKSRFSTIPEIVGLTKLSWILSCFTPYSLMLRSHTFKDAENKGADLNMWTFDYPILMAADIIGYDVDVVPVGKDQASTPRNGSRYGALRQSSLWRGDSPRTKRRLLMIQLRSFLVSMVVRWANSLQQYISMFEDSATLKKKSQVSQQTIKLLKSQRSNTCNVFALIKLSERKKKSRKSVRNTKRWLWLRARKTRTMLFLIDLSHHIETYAELNKLSDEELFEPVRRGNAKMQKRLDEVLET